MGRANGANLVMGLVVILAFSGIALGVGDLAVWGVAILAVGGLAISGRPSVGATVAFGLILVIGGLGPKVPLGDLGLVGLLGLTALLGATWASRLVRPTPAPLPEARMPRRRPGWADTGSCIAGA